MQIRLCCMIHMTARVMVFFCRDSLLIAVMNSVTSILAGFAIFSIVGYMAHETGQNVDSVVSQGN